MKILFGLFVGLFYAAAMAGQYLITFDDVPGLSSTTAMTERIARGSPKGSVFFFWGKSTSEEMHKHFKSVAAQGHYIGNHTFHHLNFEHVSTADFFNSIVQLQNQFPSSTQVQKWVRFPFLSQSTDPQKALELKRQLQKSGYRLFPVTIDTHDWYIEQLLDKDKLDTTQLDQLRRLYIEMVVDSMMVLDQLAREMSLVIPHVILLHHNWLAQQFIEDLVKTLDSLGHRPVDAKNVLEQLSSLYDEDGLYAMNIFAQLLYQRQKRSLPLLLCHDQNRLKKAVDSILRSAGNKQ